MRRNAVAASWRHAAVVASAALFALPGLVRGEEPVATSVYKAMNIPPGDVLNGTVLNAAVLPGGSKQLVALVTYMTGKKDEATAVDVRLEVFRRDGDKLVSAYGRDYGKETGALVGRGELELVNLDGDDVKDIFISFDDFRDKLVTQRRGEILTHARGTFRTVWAGEVEYDATRAAREVPAGRRDRFSRRLDPAASMKTRGQSVVFQKKMTVVAGDRLAEPKESREAFPWKPETETPR